jgi:hypothetical protein
MSSEEAENVSPIEVILRLGKGTLDTWRFRHQRGGRTQSRHKPTYAAERSNG